MLNVRALLLLSFCLFSATPITAQETGDPDPLFASDEIVEITITAPMVQLLRERPDEEYLPATLSYAEADGTEKTFDVGIRTRGNYRRQSRVCPFPPLRVNFKKAEAMDTLFHEQNKLKLVSHCRDRSERYEQNVIKEYFAYRILNMLTDISYRVRLLRVTYVDSQQKQKDRVQYAFFLEHKKRLAHRIGMPALAEEEFTTAQLEGAYSDLTSLFQFMIGNTDFSPIAGPEGSFCCHNTTPFGVEGGPVYSIPYDFDFSGLVDAPYAEPNPRFDIRRVTQRLYRGRCLHIGNLEQSMQTFQDNRTAIYQMLNEHPALEPSTLKSTTKFIDKFYATLDNPKHVDWQISDRCI